MHICVIKEYRNIWNSSKYMKFSIQSVFILES